MRRAHCCASRRGSAPIDLTVRRYVESWRATADFADARLVLLHLPEPSTLRRVSRKAAASPAAGSSKVHEAEQAALIEGVFAR